MGKKGRPSRGGGALSRLAGAAMGAGKKPGKGGMSAGLWRVTPKGDLIKVSKPRRKKRGYQMPRVLREQLESNRRLTDAIAMRVAAGHV